MEKQFATQEISLALEEIGFDGECLGYYGRVDKGFYDARGIVTKSQTPCTIAPLWQQVIDWLREKHNIEIWVNNYYRNEKRYIPQYQIFINGQQQYFQFSSASSVELYSTYFEARERAILKAIEIIKNKK